MNFENISEFNKYKRIVTHTHTHTHTGKFTGWIGKRLGNRHACKNLEYILGVALLPVTVWTGILEGGEDPKVYHWRSNLHMNHLLDSNLGDTQWITWIWFHGNPSYPPKATPPRNKALLRGFLTIGFP